MKLPIKKKWFDKIKNGEKTVEYRDAHITFVCEETGETIRREIFSVCMMPSNATNELVEAQDDGSIEDDYVVAFTLYEEGE